jgi:hypothetical protein
MEINVQWDQAKTLTFSGFDKISIVKVINNIRDIIMEPQLSNIKYPDFWDPQQI